MSHCDPAASLRTPSALVPVAERALPGICTPTPHDVSGEVVILNQNRSSPGSAGVAVAPDETPNSGHQARDRAFTTGEGNFGQRR
jgi:hypothetical protein